MKHNIVFCNQASENLNNGGLIYRVSQKTLLKKCFFGTPGRLFKVDNHKNLHCFWRVALAVHNCPVGRKLDLTHTTIDTISQNNATYIYTLQLGSIIC